MAKITIIGAGGFVFPLRLIGDILSFTELQDAELALMDVDPQTLARTARAARDLVAHHGLKTRLLETTNRREALRGADYVIVTFQVGGLAAYRCDVEIPRRYGLDPCVGDTLGPGGVFRFLRSAPAYRELARDMTEFCPDALLNYANPVAMNGAYLERLGVRTVGLCHSVQGTTRMLADALGVPYDEVEYRAAGVNHQAWILEFRRGEQDLYPRLREVMGRAHLSGTLAGTLEPGRGDHSEARTASAYEGAQERVRTEIMAAFGFFHTESSHHASEYLPYFRKNRELTETFIPQRWDYLEVCSQHDEAGLSELLARLKGELRPSLEYGAQIVHSLEAGTERVVYGDVPNDGLIDNLPQGLCAEVPCLVGDRGVQPSVIGKLPPQCAALNRTTMNVQELALEAALTGNLEHVYHAVALDPLTGALLTLTQIRDLVAELLEAEAA